jgi:hypothetical protein
VFYNSSKVWIVKEDLIIPTIKPLQSNFIASSKTLL